MIETLPDVQQLTDEQKRQLAAELWDEVLPRGPLTLDDEALVRLLDVRSGEHLAHPEQASRWEEVRQRLNAARRCMKL